jgi:DNA-binding MarR family transcriptional regulator/GNAT superfamily N-acetyltransferase
MGDAPERVAGDTAAEQAERGARGAVPDAAIRQVRSFNRSVTQRIGALNDEYLARGRPLGASRVLWEVGGEGTDLRTLRARLDLDSGYLSRLVRSLERDGLVAVAPGAGDKRVRSVRLTDAGRAERELLDRRSDELAASLLVSLSDGQRDRLVEAMGAVERLLTAGLVAVDVEDPASAAARFCIESYFAELDARFDAGFDPSRSISADVDELIEPAGLLLVARLRGEPIGCGALKLHGCEPAEVKRMWVAPSARGLGVGRRILGALEEHARRRGVGRLRLETNRTLKEAGGLYRSAGYAEVEAFNDEPYAHHWFEKRLT